MSKQNKKSFNDSMVKWTALPAIYLWLASASTVVFMGIYKPDIVLMNLDGFIALIAIIGATAAPAFATILELWKKEQETETSLHPSVVEQGQLSLKAHQEHERFLAVKEQEHQQTLALKQQEHEHCLEHGEAHGVTKGKKKE